MRIGRRPDDYRYFKITDFGPGDPRLYVVPEPKFDVRGSEEGPA